MISRNKTCINYVNLNTKLFFIHFINTYFTISLICFENQDFSKKKMQMKYANFSCKAYKQHKVLNR